MATNPDVDVVFSNPSVEDCPSDITELVSLLNDLVSGNIVGEFIAYVTGAQTPGVDDQNKVWHRVDANGRPIGTYQFYSGTWRKQYSGLVGQVVMYSGDPGVDFTGSGGAGTVGGEWDGWQLLNGQNGVANLSNKFIVGSKMDDLGVGYPAGTGPWKTSVSGTTTQEGAGVHEITLDETNTYRPATPAVAVGRWQADGNSANAGGGLYGLGSTQTIIPADAGNPTPPAIPTLPPYYALAYATFRGY